MPVLAVSGWADAYVDAVFRLLANLDVPRKGLVGPWGHMWPEIGRPGPEIGFLQECVRWWDEHLKGRDTGIMDEPMLRAWMQEPVAPAPDHDERPGRWVAEAAWPGRDEPPLAFVLDAEGLTAEPTGDAALVHTSPQTVGLDAGAWCAYGNPADIPVDQRRDDARSLDLRLRAGRGALRDARAADRDAARQRRPAARVRRRAAVRRRARTGRRRSSPAAS